MRLSHSMILLVGAVLVAIVATPSTAGFAKDGGDDAYTIKVAPASIPPGAAAAVEVVFEPAEPYKWNTDYPAKLTLTPPEGLTIEVTSFKKKDFVVDGKVGKAPLTVTATAAGNYSVEGVASFSVCDAKVCKVFRKQAVTLTIQSEAPAATPTTEATPQD